MEKLVIAKVEKKNNFKNKGYHYEIMLDFDGVPVYIKDYKAAKIAYIMMKKGEKNNINSKGE